MRAGPATTAGPARIKTATAQATGQPRQSPSKARPARLQNVATPGRWPRRASART